ncbi:1453_t:CDS:2 [Gigaspora rosea]|nr:1453_t:CDS:2 [Gigaspora rosea]
MSEDNLYLWGMRGRGYCIRVQPCLEPKKVLMYAREEYVGYNGRVTPTPIICLAWRITGFVRLVTTPSSQFRYPNFAVGRRESRKVKRKRDDEEKENLDPSKKHAQSQAQGCYQEEELSPKILSCGKWKYLTIV